MAHRVGICSSCRSRYQIPATFAHDRARCRSCGGVVEIGPLEGEADAKEAAAPMSVAAPAPAATPPVEPEIARPPATARGEEPARPTSAPRRSPLVPVLVGGLILAALAFGAWRLFG